MSGNTRGKLKEHFEGVHRNLDWCLHHIATSATLIESRLKQLPEWETVKDDPTKEELYFRRNSMYQAVTSLAEGLQTFDQLAKDIYDGL
jgi:hypothetical protein